jgi:hypothetical protein
MTNMNPLSTKCVQCPGIRSQLILVHTPFNFPFTRCPRPHKDNNKNDCIVRKTKRCTSLHSTSLKKFEKLKRKTNLRIKSIGINEKEKF